MPMYSSGSNYVTSDCPDTIAISSSNSPRFDPNPNTGHAFRADRERRVATTSIQISEKRPSHILLPVYRDSALRPSIPP